METYCTFNQRKNREEEWGNLDSFVALQTTNQLSLPYWKGHVKGITFHIRSVVLKKADHCFREHNYWRSNVDH